MLDSAFEVASKDSLNSSDRNKERDKCFACCMFIEHQTGVDFIGSFLIADIIFGGLDIQAIKNANDMTTSFKFVYGFSKIFIFVALFYYA